MLPWRSSETASSNCPLVAALDLHDDTVVDIVREGTTGVVHQDAEKENL
jgi:hypothetical protein